MHMLQQVNVTAARMLGGGQHGAVLLTRGHAVMRDEGLSLIHI